MNLQKIRVRALTDETVLGNVLCINSLFIYHTLYKVYCIMYDIHYTTLLQCIMYICILHNGGFLKNRVTVVFI